VILFYDLSKKSLSKALILSTNKERFYLTGTKNE